MKIIISPAKKMKDATADFLAETTPTYLAQAQTIFAKLNTLDRFELKEVWRCSEKLLQENYQRLKQTDLTKDLTPALFSYDGLQYSSLAADLLDGPSLDYLTKNLRILSGLYGILRPLDGIVCYRLEMGAKLKVERSKDLYDFWQESLYKALYTSKEPVINLASKEYAKAITPYLTKDDQFITCEFKEYDQKRQKYVQKATHAKQARGQFVRFLAENKVTDLKQLTDFDAMGYKYRKELSTKTLYVFTKG